MALLTKAGLTKKNHTKELLSRCTLQLSHLTIFVISANMRVKVVEKEGTHTDIISKEPMCQSGWTHRVAVSFPRFLIKVNKSQT